ncbi:MAG: type II CRISPR RNA-guided endonuclease Cas9 [Phycisphaerae bacterium]|nr:type II CRISPR RNA-guided endonuclease Cas9 [Phycisphaerae bacterium]
MAKVPYVLGLDIGSNSVGSCAWRTDTNELFPAVSVFPAGVEVKPTGERGDPVGRERRQSRSLRRVIQRRAARRRAVWRQCIASKLLPATRAEIDALFQDEDKNPWKLRAEGLTRELSPHEFGRILLHLAQRRGGLGLRLPAPDETEPGDKENTSYRAAYQHTTTAMREVGAQTYGQLIWKRLQESVRSTKSGAHYAEPVRNRNNLLVSEPEKAFFASRDLIRAEFDALWKKQRSFNGPLAVILTDDFRRVFDNPTEDKKWRHQGILFGQRRTIWDEGTLGRCTLEPTDRCCPLADRHAQRFRILQTVNILRLLDGVGDRPLNLDERGKILQLLSTPQTHDSGKYKGKSKHTVSVTDLRKALGLKRGDKSIRLNIEAKDSDVDISTDWFARSFVHGAFGEARWNALSEAQRESVNRAVLKLDPEEAAHENRLRSGAAKWWGLAPDQCEAFILAWRNRPKPEKRIKLSRRALLNILPIMEKVNALTGKAPTEIEARKAFAEDADSIDHATGKPPTSEKRARYFRAVRGLNAADRRYIKKHQNQLPPAPMMTNPVVRKAIHEVRRHIAAYIQKFGCKPERVVLEFARDATQTAVSRNQSINQNRWRDKQRREIESDIVQPAYGKDFFRLSTNQRRVAIDRVLLSRQQAGVCPYCGNQPKRPALTERLAASGTDCEIDHIQPYSISGDNSLNNKVLCHTDCNRAKKNRTPREWWGDQFDAKSLHAQKMFDHHEWSKGDYFNWKDYQSKWRKFTREARATDAFSPGQLEATAYAAKAVKAYLSDALYGSKGSSEHGGDRAILVTHGKYTAVLRRDWQLFQTLKASNSSESEAAAQKNRADHRHHAVDAAVIALTTDELLPKLGTLAKEQEEHFARTGHHVSREPMKPPFGKDAADFRRAVLSRIFESFDAAHKTGAKADGEETGTPLLVSHRPVKRKLIGHLHKDTLYGAVLLPNGSRDPNKTTSRIAAAALKPAHLRVPEGWDERSEKLNRATTKPQQAALLRRELASMDDPSPGKSGIVRDRSLRDRLRRSLRELGLDPDQFTDKQLAEKLKAGKQLTLDSGIPVRNIVLLRTNSDPVVIVRNRFDAATGQTVPDTDPRTARIYDSQNNHHVEIREDRKGRWIGTVVRAFDAARRVREDGLPSVDRSDNTDGVFVMSISEGETVRMKRPGSETADCFVLFKIDKKPDGSCGYMHFIHHWDARGASEKRDSSGSVIANSARDDVAVSPDQMKSLSPESGVPPYKVRVTALGEAIRLEKD